MPGLFPFAAVTGKSRVLGLSWYTWFMRNIFKDRRGKIIIAQKPNLPIIVWFISFTATYLPFRDNVLSFLELFSFGVLFTWAWLEIFSGVNVFRRLLGAAVMIGLLIVRL